MSQQFEVPKMPTEIIFKLALIPTSHKLGVSKNFEIIIYDYKDGILCGMMDEHGGPSDKILFTRKNTFKFITMSKIFVETAPIETIDRYLQRLHVEKNGVKVKRLFTGR